MTEPAAGKEEPQGLLHRLAGSPVFSGFVGLLERVCRPRPNSFQVLTYHRVDYPSHRPMLAPNLALHPQKFARQMEWLATHCRVLSLEEILETHLQGRPLPPRTVAITFDDGYQDFDEQAWPVLRRLQLPATLFVPTAFPGQPQQTFWWDRLYHALSTTSAEWVESPWGKLPLGGPRDRSRSYEKLREQIKRLPNTEGQSLVDQTCGSLDVSPFDNPVLDWAALNRLAGEGVTIAPHGFTHARLNHLSRDEAHYEICRSRDDIKRRLGRCPALFAYPEGAYSEETAQLVAEAGFQFAFTTVPGNNVLSQLDPLRIRRLNVGGRTTLPVLRARLLSGPWGDAAH